MDRSDNGVLAFRTAVALARALAVRDVGVVRSAAEFARRRATSAPDEADAAVARKAAEVLDSIVAGRRTGCDA